MTADVEWSLLGIQTGNDFEARLVDGTFRFLGVLQGNADLITQFRTLVGLEILYGLSKVVLDEVEEGGVVLLLYPRVSYDEGTVRYDRKGRLIERGLIRADALRSGADLVALNKSSGTTSTENIDVDDRERCGRVGHTFGKIQETPE